MRHHSSTDVTAHISLKAPSKNLDNDNMRSNPKRIVQLAIIVAIVASACSSNSTAAPEVMLEARWQCDVQRQTFANLTDLDAELSSRLQASGLSRQEYETFKEDLGTSVALRQEVSDEYDAYCTL